MICQKCGADNPEDDNLCISCGAPFIIEESGSGATRIGLQQNVVAVLCYLLGWITGLIFILTEKENQFVRFHAMQSIFTFGGLTWLFIMVFAITVLLIEIPAVGDIAWLSYILGFWPVVLLVIVIWILLMTMAYRGKRFKLLWIGDYAEKFL